MLYSFILAIAVGFAASAGSSARPDHAIGRLGRTLTGAAHIYRYTHIAYLYTCALIMDSDLQAKVMIELSTAGRKARKLFDGLVRKRGLTLARARALLLLSAHGSWNQTELAEALEIEHPSVVRLLDGLERQGLIVRTAVEGDRRAKHIKQTPLATQQVQELEKLSATARAVLLKGIEAEDLAITLAVLRRIIKNAESAAPEPGELDVRAQ